MSDDGFREIQLTGKQLVALFMAAAVVLIAAFLSGVLVGRGVRAQVEPSASAEAERSGAGAVDPTASPAPPRPAPVDEQPQMPPAAPPPPPEEAPATPPVAAAGPQPANVSAGGASPLAVEPAGSGYFVKVVAYRGQAQADRVAARLAAKGYATWVAPVRGQGATLYSVRVGKFASRTEADEVRRRLEQEEQFKPSVAR